jgi:hypothetical protein
MNVVAVIMKLYLKIILFKYLVTFVTGIMFPASKHVLVNQNSIVFSAIDYFRSKAELTDDLFTASVCDFV